MKSRDKPYEEIYDLMAVRVLVNSVPECYHALGVIHDGWTPLQERIKDYIAQPKSNGYQSLHTTVFGPGRQLYEVQIRTREMHDTAEYGIAAHWLYKENRSSADKAEQDMSWLRQILEFQLDAKNPDEFLEFLKLDLYQKEIFVLTPTGDVIELPEGRDADRLRLRRAHRGRAALPGREGERPHRAALARAAQLGHGRDRDVAHGASRAATGSRTCARAARATRSGSGFASRSRTPRPRSGARCSTASCAAATSSRTTRCSREAAKALGLNDSKHLISSIGQGDIAIAQALKIMFPEESTETPAKASTIERLVRRMRGPARGVRIQGVDGLMVRYSQCCQPVPGDPVVGYVTRGRGVSIHRGGLSQRAPARRGAGAPTRHRLEGAGRASSFSSDWRSKDRTDAGSTRTSPPRLPRAAPASRAWSSSPGWAATSPVQCCSRSRISHICRSSPGSSVE